MAKSRREVEKKKRRYADAKAAAAKALNPFEITTIQLPKGMQTFSFKKEGRYRLDVLPFTAGTGNPGADEGIDTYERRYFVHKAIGAESKWYSCPAKNFKKRCPICEQLHYVRQATQAQHASAPWQRSLH